MGCYPAQNPEYIMLICVDEPSAGSYYGSIVASPYAKTIFSKLFEYKNIKPDDPELAQEGLTEASPSPQEGQTGTEAGEGTPTPEPDATDANAGGKGVRNILLGGLGVLALGAGIFLILLGKKKEEDEEAA